MRNATGSIVFGFILLLVAHSLGHGQARIYNVDTAIGLDGKILTWMVNGPYSQPMVGFGVPADFDPIGEAGVRPVWSQRFDHADRPWVLQPTRDDGFFDFNDVIGWSRSDDGVESIWFADVAYAHTVIVADQATEAVLKAGGNSRMKIILNGVVISSSDRDENASPDAVSVPVQLKAGENHLLVRTTRTHQNIGIVLFEELSYDWGFFLTLHASTPLATRYRHSRRNPESVVKSTFFYKDTPEGSRQRHDFYIEHIGAPTAATITATVGSQSIPLLAETLQPGVNRIPGWLPEVPGPTEVRLDIQIDGSRRSHRLRIVPMPKYTLHLMPLSHLDIGYTHPQPLVKEIHLRHIDEVMDLMDSDPEYRWTIEGTWILDAYLEGRGSDQIERLKSFIRSGRIAFSPFYSNPFTGMVDTEEMIRSMTMGQKLARDLGVDMTAAIYNDVPGQSWILPQLLNDQGVKLLINGLNEVYGGYVLQQSLPKVFHWEGSDASRVVFYRTESYNEGMAYGLERGNEAIAHRTWTRIQRMQAHAYPSSHIILNAAFGDNLGIARRQWEAHKRWNEEYSWPKFKASTIHEAADALLGSIKSDLPVVRGDATSDWDIQFQGEPDRMQRYRNNQHMRTTAENIATMAAILNPQLSTYHNRLNKAIELQLEYSGHGSGLEFGYGTDEENARTLAYRESYVSQATQNIDEVLERAKYGWIHQQASLEGEFAIIFNPHGFPLSGHVSLDFNPMRFASYSVEEIDGTPIEHTWDQFNLSFYMKDLPPFGWKKVRLVPLKPQPTEHPKWEIGDNSVSNGHIRIEYDPTSGHLTSIHQLKDDVRLSDAGQGFAALSVSAGGVDKPFTHVELSAAEIRIEDRRPVSMTVHINRANSLLPSMSYTLYNESDAVHITSSFDLRKLGTTDQPKMYAIEFPIAIDGADVFVESLGGFMDGLRDRLPGMGTAGYSMREVLTATNGLVTVDIASPDNRVTYVHRENDTKQPVIRANIANQFPESWNRREENSTVIVTNFAVRVRAGAFDPGSSHRFGQSIAIPPVPLKWWFNTQPISETGLQVNSEHSFVTSLQPIGDDIGDGVLIRIKNTHPMMEDAISIDAPWLRTGSLCRTDLLGGGCEPVDISTGAVTLTLGPNQIATLKWKQ